jgi:hypothetical protein
MMRRFAIALTLALVCLLPLRAEQKKTSDKSRPRTISLSGCVVSSEKTPDQFTIEDASEGKFRLTGLRLRDYVGQRVQLAGAVVETRRLTVKGGLLPNPNVAAQAGAMDPARAAVASAGGSAGPGTVDLPEFKVKSVRPVSGACPD